MIKFLKKLFKLRKSKSYIKSTKEGKLYITTEDFFKQKKIRKTIYDLLNSNMIKNIKNNK